MFRQNRLLAKLKADETCYGAWLFLGSPHVSEVLGLVGFDALIIDHEHSPGGIETAIHQMRAIQAAGSTTVLARVGANDTSQIKMLLDAGVEGLLLPNVESADEARAFVAACRYPPAGRRSAHYTVSRAAHWGLAANSYYRDVESQMVLVAMIESEKGVLAIPEIAKVTGLTMLFFGPLDLSGSIGKMGLFSDPDLKALLQQAESAALASGMLLGGAIIPGDKAADYFQRGYRFLTVGSDVVMLREGAVRSLQPSN